MPTAFVTGTAGFIGFHVARRLLGEGWNVVGLDSFDPYYDVALKEARHQRLEDTAGYTGLRGKLETPGLLMSIFEDHQPEVVVHLAAQAGVRFSIENPQSYVESNLLGTFQLLEALRAHPAKHALLASTSSAYGANTEMPYVESHQADHQMSFYAATKKATEAMAHSYAHLYHQPVTMFRFFTVYGPWGRPDMALFKFADAILKGRPIDVYNHGKMSRDFTYIDDLVEGIFRLISAVPPLVEERGETDERDTLSPVAPWRVVNIGNGSPTKLMDFVEALEAELGQKAERNYMDMQPGDVHATWADTALLTALVGALPRTELRDGIAQFVTWFRGFNKR